MIMTLILIIQNMICSYMYVDIDIILKVIGSYMYVDVDIIL